MKRSGAGDRLSVLGDNASKRLTKRPLVIDIGGEGRHRRAWNLNPRIQRTLGPLRGRTIDRLIQGRGEKIPLATASVDVVIVERTPLRTATLIEIGRVVRPGGWVVLRHALAPLAHPHEQARRMLTGSTRSAVMILDGQELLQTIIRLHGPAPPMNGFKAESCPPA